MSNHSTENPENEDRGMPSVSSRKKGGIVEKMMFVVVGIVVIIALIAINGGFSKSEKREDQEEITKTRGVVNILGDAPDIPEPPKVKELPKEAQDAEDMISTYQTPPPPPPPSANRGSNSKKELTPEERKLTSGLLIYGDRGQGQQRKQTPEEQARNLAAAQGGGGSFMGGGGSQPQERIDGLGANLKATRLEGVKAGLLVDRDMFITTGTFLDCALETAISSDLAGMTSCRITRDIYSTSGKVLLLERGSRITGQYQGGLKRGQARIFVLWNRVETPNGVMVTLDSIGTGALGHSGHSGFIDTHFWERFGSAMMLSLVDDVGGYVLNRNQSNSSINLSSTEGAANQAAAIALENSINIPPTLVKNQGEHINVFIARDLDFRGVYDLEPK